MNVTHVFVPIISLHFASLAAPAARLPEADPPVRLPAYTVTVPRQTPAERQLAQSVARLRALARRPLPLKTTLPLLRVAAQPARRAPARGPLTLAEAKS